MTLPSKELLNELYNVFKVEDGIVYEEAIYDCGYGYREISFYELLFDMKDFILDNYQIMGTYYSTSVSGWCCWIEDLGNKGIAETEYEAVKQTCEWILDERNK